MGRRLDLQAKLETILGSRNVYFQPPSSIKMNYPAIVYARDQYYINHADNEKYTIVKRYSVVAIYDNPDSDLPDKILSLPYCSFDRNYTVDNLYHDVFTLYF